MKLEVLKIEDGCLSRRGRNSLRNYFPGTLNSFGPFVDPFYHIIVLADIVTLFARKDGRRLSDLACGTVVVQEMSGRKERLEAKLRIDEVRDNEDLFLSNLPKESYGNNLWFVIRNNRYKTYSFHLREYKA